MMKKHGFALNALVLTLAVALSGCVKTTTTTVGSGGGWEVPPEGSAGTASNSQAAASPATGSAATSGPTTPDSIQVFYSPPSDRSYTELGLVTTQTGQTIFHDRSAEGMIRKMQEEAAKIGADAIIVRDANEGTWGLTGGGNTGFSRGNAQAVAIKFN